MNFYGSELWYKAVDNSEKFSITVMPSSIGSFTKLLEDNELCYYGFDNGKIGKISVNKSDIDLIKSLVGHDLAAVMKVEEITKPYKPDEKNVFGTVEYKYIAKKTRKFLTGESEAEQKAMLRTAELLKRDGVKFSGRAYGDKVTLTLNEQDMEKATAYYKNALDHIEKLPDQIEQDRVSGNIEAVIDKMIDLGFTDEQMQSDYFAIIRVLSAFRDVDIADYLMYLNADFTADQNKAIFVLLKEIYESGGFDLISPSEAQDKLYELEKEYKLDVLLREYFDLHSFNDEQIAAIKDISINEAALTSDLKYIDETYSPAEIKKLHAIWSGEKSADELVVDINKFIEDQKLGATGIGYTDSFSDSGNGTVSWVHRSYDEESGERFRQYTATYKEILLAETLFDDPKYVFDYLTKTANYYEIKNVPSALILSYRRTFADGELLAQGDTTFFDRIANAHIHDIEIFTVDDMALYIANDVEDRISEDQLRQLIKGKTDELLLHGGIDEKLSGYSRSDVLLLCSELRSSPFADNISSNLTEKVKSELERKGVEIVVSSDIAAEKYTTEQLVGVTKEILGKQEELTGLVAANEFEKATELSRELSMLSQRAAQIKAAIQKEDITQDDVAALRDIEPKRKAVPNLLETEVAQTPKFEKMLGEELGEKSPYEMRRGNLAWREDETETVPIIEVEKRDVSDIMGDMKKGLIQRGNFVNDDTNMVINVGQTGIRDTLAHSIYDSKRGDNTNGRLSSLYQIEDIIKNAVCFDTVISEVGKNKSPNTLFMHKFYAVINYENNPYLAQLSVEESYSTNRDGSMRGTENRFYNLKDIRIAPIRLNAGFQSHGIPSEDDRAKPYGAIVELTIPQLYNIVKQYDKSFYENEQAPGRAEREAEIAAQQEFEQSVKKLDEHNASLDRDNPTSVPMDTKLDGSDFDINEYDDPDYFEQQKLADKEEDETLRRAEAKFTDFAEEYLTNNPTVRNVFENSDKENMRHDIERLMNVIVTDLILGNQMIDDLKEDDLIAFLNEYDRDTEMQQDIIDTLLNNVSENLTELREARETAKQLGIPFVDRLTEGGDDEPNPYVYDGSMSPEDFEKYQERYFGNLEEVFFHNPHTGRIDEVYYNPDGNDGNGQYVTVSFGYELIADADAHSNTPDEFFDYLSTHGETELDDRGTGGFSGVEKRLAEETPIFRECTEKTMEGLIALSEKELSKQQQKTVVSEMDKYLSDEANLPEILKGNYSSDEIPDLAYALGIRVSHLYEKKEVGTRAQVAMNEFPVIRFSVSTPMGYVRLDTRSDEKGLNISDSSKKDAQEHFYSWEQVGKALYDMALDYELDDMYREIIAEAREKTKYPYLIRQAKLKGVEEKAYPVENARKVNKPDIHGEYLERAAEGEGYVLKGRTSEIKPGEVITKSPDDVVLISFKNAAEAVKYLRENRYIDMRGSIREECLFSDEQRKAAERSVLRKGTYKIYQLPDGEKYHGIRFESLKQLHKENVRLNFEDYKLVYDGYNDNLPDFSRDTLLDTIFTEFNTNIQSYSDFGGHSLSVSDVVVTEIDGEQKAYYCDRAGWTEMHEFFVEKVIPPKELKPIYIERNGDFFEAYGESAKTAARLLGLQLIQSDRGEKVGFPDSKRQEYDRLLNISGYDTVFEDSTSRCMRYIDEFCEKEYKTKGDYSDLAHVGIAFTEHEDTGLPIEVYADLETWRIVKEYGGKVVSEEQFNNIEEMADYLEVLDFNELVYLENDERPIEIGDRYEYGGKEYTVVSLQGDHPDEVKVSYIEISPLNFTQEENVSNIYIDTLLNESVYLGKAAELDRENYTAEKDEDDLLSDIDLGHISDKQDTSWIDQLEKVVEQAEADFEKNYGTDTKPQPSKRTKQSRRKNATVSNVWSDFEYFDGDGQKYGVAEIDKLMKLYDDEVTDRKRSFAETGDFYPTYSMEFTIDLPDGRVIEENRELGNGVGGLIDFLKSQGDTYSDIIPQLEEQIERENKKPQRSTKRMEQQENDLRQLTLSFDEPPKEAERSDEQTEQPDKPSFQGGESVVSVSKAAENNAPLPEKEKVNVSNNYRITDEHIGEGTKSERFKNNIAAIKTLKAIESENRLATPEEQEILAKYVGWGGLAECFVDRHHSNAELRHYLTDEEYAAARESTLTAFYTPPIVMQEIYKKLGEMGFEGGRVLEPSCGVGNFIGTMPEDMQRGSDIHAVELDSISGRIAQKLYPAADIQVKGFEKTRFNDNSFDVAVGNVPFGDISVRDKQYDKHNWRIHNYFFGKTLDKVRPGGVVAFLTSRYTLDSKNSAFRQYLAERADLLGAVRLPTGTFSKAAGTEVVSDIIFLQKRDEVGMPEVVPDWVQTTQTADGFSINNYFSEHPEMVLGEIQVGKGIHGRPEMIVKANEDVSLADQLEKAMQHINGTISEQSEQREEEIEVHFQNEAAAPDELRNRSLFVQDGKVYFKLDDQAVLWEKGAKSDTVAERAKAFIGLRDMTRALLDAMVNDCSDAQLKAMQQELSRLYDDFRSKDYGLIHSSYNKRLFGDDISYQLVAALESRYDLKTGEAEKSDLFTKRTIRPPVKVKSVDTAQEALAISIAEHGRVDLGFMSALYETDKDTIINELKGQIFPVPELSDEKEIVYQERSEYLSGDIRQKLNAAEAAAQTNPQLYSGNIKALTEVMPEPLKAGDIDAKIGGAWIDPKYYEQFMYETFKTPTFSRRNMSYRIYDTIELSYSNVTNAYSISHKSSDKSVFATKTFGMDIRGASAYDIFENLLNFRDTKIYKTVEDAEGKEKRVVDPEKTKLAANKAKKIQDAFSEWIFKDPERREYLVNKYNEMYNSIRPREYDGSALTFPGMNADITLREHQKDAIAHAIYGGNTLFDHSVGAGKTFEMIASVMERKRLGISNKALMCVPNHLTEQIGDDFQKLYPNANILVATKNDFSKENRRALISKIATGDYDAIIIGHTQLGMIPLSKDTQEKYLQEEVEQLTSAIAEMKKIDGKSFGVKEAEKRKKNLQKQLDELQTRKDDIVTFEELGVDTLVLDEAHEFKNLHTPTNMQNVSGIGSAASKKASDLYMKCQYLNEKTGNKGLIFATGTPISNSVTELFTMQRYLQSDVLRAKRISHFDQWIGMFGHKVTDYQIDPTGKKFKLKTRIAKYTNMTELMSMFKSVADIKTADMMKLDVPDCETNIVNVEPTQLQQELVEELAFRADKVENGSVDPTVDNFLKITSDGRKVGLDPRLIDPDLEDDPNTKLNKCVENVFQIYKDTAPDKLTQLIFCDLGVPNGKNAAKAKGEDDDELSVAEKESFEETGPFCIYDDIKSKLIERGVKPDEIAFIHDAKTEDQKAKLFEKVRNGEVRVLLGSTPKMGTGTNIQTRLAALHDLDVPWRPADLEQRLGRMVRQGNRNKKVKLFRYVTKGTFDAYSYQTLENKQRYIAQLYTGNSRTCEDVDQQSLSYSEIKTLCTGDERLKEVMQLDNDISNLSALKRDHTNTVYEMQDKLKEFQKDKAKMENGIEGVKKDLEICSKLPKDPETGGISFEIKIDGVTYTDKTEAAKQLERVFKRAQGELVHGDEVKLATMYGFDVKVKFSPFWETFHATVSGNANYDMKFSDVSPSTNIKRLMNVFDGMQENLQSRQDILARQTAEANEARQIANTPFPKDNELAEKITRRDELKAELQAEQAAKAAEGKDKPQTFHFSMAELKRNSKKVAQSKPPDGDRGQSKKAAIE